jgi:hypothetical protein
LHKEESQNESRSAPDEEDYCRWRMASATSEEESQVGTFSRNVELEQEEGANRKAVRGAGYGAMRDRKDEAGGSEARE